MRVRSLFAFAVSLALAACAPLQERPLQASAIPATKGLLGGPYLRVDGARLVAGDGRAVTLRGINLGGWLVTEAWMCGFSDDRDTREAGASEGGAGRSAQETLEARFGSARAQTLLDAWRDHWITERDLDQIRGSGFNLVRVPIGYRTLQNADGSWILDRRGRIDFSRMDWIVHEAGRRGIYTVFDLHVWPDQRLDYEKIGRLEGEPIRRQMSRLWTAIATHYRGEGAVAGLDLINELPGAWGVQQVLSEAVRRADPERIQIVEGFNRSEFIKLHRNGAFPNSIFAEHLYASKPMSAEELSAGLHGSRANPFPIYISEFLAQDLQSAITLLDANHTNWSSWTYKTVDMGDWGMFNYHADMKVDLQRDPYNVILGKWTSGLTAWQMPGLTRNVDINDERKASPREGLR